MVEKNGKKPISPEERMVQKYGMKTPEAILEHERRIEETKTKYVVDAIAVEKALTEFLEILDPILWNSKPIMWVRRPTMAELHGLIPPDVEKYLKETGEVPDDVAKKYENFVYEKMASMVMVPKYTAEEWKSKANPWLLKKFWKHIGNIAQIMQDQTEGF